MNCLSISVELLATLIEGLICMFSTITILCKEIKVREYIKKICYSAISYTVIISLLNYVQLVSKYTTLIAVLVLSVSGYLVIKKDFKCCFVISALFIMFQMALEMTIICSASVITNDPDYILRIISNNNIARIILIFIIKGLIVSAFFIFKNFLRRLNYDALEKPLCVVITVMGLGMLLKMMSIIITNRLSELRIGISVLFLAFIVTMILILYLFDRLLRERADTAEQGYLIIKNNLLERNLKNINGLYKENSKKFHEFKHHISVLSVMLKNQQFEKMELYFDDINKVMGFKPEYMTGNEIIDIVLNVESTELKNKGIQFDVSVDVPKTLLIKDSDLCSLLLNIIENAAEAVEKEDNKSIIISIKSVGNMLLVSSCNQSSVNPIKNQFTTTKTDDRGWGLQIINDIVKKYDGEIEHNYENGKYIIDIFLVQGDTSKV